MIAWVADYVDMEYVLKCLITLRLSVYEFPGAFPLQIVCAESELGVHFGKNFPWVVWIFS